MFNGCIPIETILQIFLSCEIVLLKVLMHAAVQAFVHSSFSIESGGPGMSRTAASAF